MSSTAVVETVCDIMPLATLYYKSQEDKIFRRQVEMDRRIPIMEELEIVLGDLHFSRSRNWKYQHKIKYIDCMVELKFSYKTPTGKIYKYLPKGSKINILYSAFNQKEYSIEEQSMKYPNSYDSAKKFVKILLESVNVALDTDTLGFASLSLVNEDLKKAIKAKIIENTEKWLDEWKGMKFHCLTMNSLLETFEKYFVYSGKLFDLEEIKTSNDIKEILKEFPTTAYWYSDCWDFIRHFHNRFNIRKLLTETFTKIHRHGVNGLYTCSIKRTYDGSGMNYSASYHNETSIIHWKKCMKNGNCSNKGLKALHVYYKPDGWLFGGLSACHALDICLINGYKYDKKKDKKPTYHDLKMWWWLKLE